MVPERFAPIETELDSFEFELAAAAASVQAFALPESSADAALVVQLPPGNYTFQVAAKGSTSGTVLGEAYELP